MRNSAPLQFLAPAWFSVVLGLTGLALAWHAADPVMGANATGVSLVLGSVGFVVFVGVSVLSGVRARRYPAALAEDLRHPARHGFVAALPLAVLLMAALAVALGLQGPWLDAAWWAGSLGQLGASVWVLRRWLVATPLSAPNAAPAPFWPHITPVLLISVVGNVVAPLAGLVLGHSVWSMAQFGIGLLMWPVVLALLMVRRAAHGPLPERMAPTWFIAIAPPSVVGLVGLQAQAPLAVVAAFWGMAVFLVLWIGGVAKQAVVQPFSLAFWATSFPMASFTTLTLKLAVAVGSPGLQVAGTLLLALTSLVVFGLCLATVRGLRNGSLLAPEPVAVLNPGAL